MKLCVFALATILSICTVCAGDIKPATSDELIALVAKRNALTLVTPKPVKMPELIWTLCFRPPGPADKVHADHNPNGHYKVFVTDNGAAAMKNEKATFPVGAVIVKEKLMTKDAKDSLLFTGMLKREKNYNPDCGDWEFFLVSGDGKTVTERGMLKSCIVCHLDYSASDFVTKKYK